jgi:hypothetical protein
MEARRWPVVLVAAAVLALAGAAPAWALPDSAYFKHRAWFNASIEGTYVAHGTEERQCSREVGPDQFEQFTVTRTEDETLRFKSVRPVRLEADQYRGGDIGAGSLGRRTPVAVTTTKTLTTTAVCDPNHPDPVCGTKHLNFGISLIARSSPLRLYYDFNDGAVIFPDDPFDAECSVSHMPWWGKVGNTVSARMSGRKLFNTRLRHLTLKGALGKPTASGRYDLTFAVTLVRTHR